MAARRVLDLCCGAGLASWGYWLSGRFTEVVGVDLDGSHAGRYAFDFVQGDALALTYDFLDQFDFIHASPPCQGYSYQTPDQTRHERQIPAFLRMLYASGKPHAVENVPGSQRDLRPNLALSGLAFGLPSHRPRYFYVSTLGAALRLMKMSASPGANVSSWPVTNLSGRPGANVSNQDVPHISGASGPQMIVDHIINVHADGGPPRADVIKALGLDVIPARQLAKISVAAMSQGIPPAFTKFIAEQSFEHKAMIA